MNTLEFIADMTQTLIWPLTVLAIVFILKRPIFQLFGSLYAIKFKDFELNFKQTLEDINKKSIGEIRKTKPDKAENKEMQSILEIADTSPKSAVIESWAHLEHALIEFAQKCKIKLTPDLLKKPMDIGNLLLEMKIIDNSINQIIRSLRLLRNQAVHYEKTIVSKEDAVNYTNTVFKIISYFKAKSA